MKKLVVIADGTEIIRAKANNDIYYSDFFSYKCQHQEGSDLNYAEIIFLVESDRYYSLDYFDKWGNYFEFDELILIDTSELCETPPYKGNPTV
jgi:hypothetical protein